MRPPTRLIDLTNKVFGERTVLHQAPTGGPGKQARWVVRCSCGDISTIQGAELRKGQANRCAECRRKSERERREIYKRSGKPDRSIADEVSPGLTVNTLVVEREAHGQWRVHCRFCNRISLRFARHLLAGSAVCDTCGPPKVTQSRAPRSRGATP